MLEFASADESGRIVRLDALEDGKRECHLLVGGVPPRAEMVAKVGADLLVCARAATGCRRCSWRW